MAGVDLPAGGGGRKKGKKGKAKKRISIRIDMTPMVDVIMLLLTFFMLTTVFTQPQTLEINIPPENVNVEVGYSQLLTLRVTADGTIYYNMGIEMPQPVAFKDLHNLLVEKLQAEPKLVTLIKVHRNGSFGLMVDILDEINLASITRFSLAPFTEADEKVIRKVTGA